MTPTDLQDAIVQALKEQLTPLRLTNSAGHEVGVKVCRQQAGAADHPLRRRRLHLYCD